MAVAVDYETSDGSAVAPGDYISASGKAIISSGATSVTIQLTIVEDNVDELTETFTFALTTSTGATISQTSGSATVEVLDDDPAPTMAIGDLTVTETDGTAPVTVVLSGASSGGVRVDVATRQGTATAGVDYVSTTATLTWSPDESGAKVVVVPLIDDGAVEGAEYVEVALTNAATVGASAEGVTVGDSSAVLKIVDDEAPTLTAIPAVDPRGLITLAALVAAALLWMQRRSPGKNVPS